MNNHNVSLNNSNAFSANYNRHNSVNPLQSSTADQMDSLHLLRNLKELSQLNKWIFITHAADIPSRAILEAAGIDLRKLVVLKESTSLSELEVINRALCANTASAIISSKPKLQEDVLSVLRNATVYSTKVMFTGSSVSLH
ncbi:MAG: hypothetical protein JKY55_16155 [Aliivibrio sp.]|uniref:SulA-like leucine-rich domain-containing protein n=1 Tax=Aliivibrio sp. TaxID=1872443 RepID=UPI001A45C5EA|nr:hypothetical protein [Aliivibrio sp.]